MARITYDQRVEWSLEVLRDLKAYWPLTLRQIFYRLVSQQYIPNEQMQYKALSAALSQARKDGLVPWRVIEDRTRPLYGSTGWDDASYFLHDMLTPLANHYRRNLMAYQNWYIELFVEKQALITPFERAAQRYHLLVNMGRGYSSTTVLKKMADRLKDAQERGYQILVLAFSDFDPSGVDLVDNLSRQFNELAVWENIVWVDRIALTAEQVADYDLPHDPRALKMTDSRAAAFIEKHGEYAVELDALAPPVLEELVHGAIEKRLDLEEFECQVEIEKEERQALAEKVEEWLS